MLPNDDRTAKGIADFGVRGFDAVVPMRTAGFRSVILEMRDPEASSRLIGLLSDPDANTRRVAASALTYYPSDPKIAEVCIARIPIEKHDWTREELIKNIAKHGGESAIPLLIDLAKKERSYYAPIDGIKFIGGPQGKRALEQLQNEPKIGAYAKSSLNSLRVHEESMNIKAKKKSNAK
jgi:HEAT repeat protein